MCKHTETRMNAAAEVASALNCLFLLQPAHANVFFQCLETCLHSPPTRNVCTVNRTGLQSQQDTRAQVQLPAPPSQVPPSIVFTVRGIVECRPNSHLGGTQTQSHIASLVPNAHTCDSLSATESEMGSLTWDTGPLFDSASSVSSDDGEASEKQGSTRGQFVLGGVPQAHRRNVSEAGPRPDL